MMSLNRSQGQSQAPVTKRSKPQLGSNSSLGANSRRTQQRSLMSTSAGAGESSGNIGMGAVDLGIDTSPLMQDFNLDNHDKVLFDLYRDIYWHDASCGCATDMFSTMPFSEFSIGGGNDKQLLPYQEAIEVLNLRSGMSRITIDQLVTGTHLSSIIHNKTDKSFIDLMTHRVDNAKISPLPFVSQDPLIEVSVPEEVRSVLGRTDSPRIQALIKRLGSGFVERLLSGNIELDPLGTLYLPRKTFSFGEGVSWYKRVLPIYLIEKNLFRGTLVESGKRQRGIMHMQVGDGDQWTPDIDELEFLTDLFQNADLDPLGAIVATRLGVNIDEFRQGGDFWKVTDVWDQTGPMKLRALGISESFLSGEAQFAYEQQGSMTVFMESLKAFRDNMTRNIFYEKVFPLVSMMNGYAVNQRGKIIRKDNLMEGDIEDKLRTMNDGSKLFIPSVHWAKSLSTEADTQKMDTLRTLTELGVPVPLRAMAAAGGFNLDTLLVDQAEDMSMQRKILEYKKRVDDIKSEYKSGEDDMGGGFGSFSSVVGDGGPTSIASRDFGESSEIVGRTKTGKKKYIHNQNKANEDANLMMLKSLSALRESSEGNMLDFDTTTKPVATKRELEALQKSGMF